MWTLYMRFYSTAYFRVVLSSADFTFFVKAIWMGGRKRGDFRRYSKPCHSASELSSLNTPQEVYTALGSSLNRPTSDSSTIDLIIAAYRPSPETDPDIFLPSILPVLISSIQTNSFLDESLAVLARTLHLRQ